MINGHAPQIIRPVATTLEAFDRGYVLGFRHGFWRAFWLGVIVGLCFVTVVLETMRLAGLR